MSPLHFGYNIGFELFVSTVVEQGFTKGVKVGRMGG